MRSSGGGSVVDDAIVERIFLDNLSLTVACNRCGCTKDTVWLIYQKELMEYYCISESIRILYDSGREPVDQLPRGCS
jgi:hypothetical protein